MLDKVTYLEQVTGLSIDRTDKLLDECRSIVFLNLIVRQVCPLGLNLKLLIFNTTVNSRIVAMGMTRVIRKNADCKMVLVRLPRPIS